MNKDKPNQVAVLIRIDAGLVNDLGELANFNSIPRSVLIRLALYRYVKRNKGKKVLQLID